MQQIKPQLAILPLIKSPKHEHEFAIQQRSLNPIDHALRNSSETGVALHSIAAQFYSDIVERGAIRRPKLRRFHDEGMGPVDRDLDLQLDELGVGFVEDEIGGCGCVGGAVDRYVDWCRLAKCFQDRR